MPAELAIGVPPVVDRSFAACVLCSLALHGAVGWWTATGHPAAAPGRPPLLASLRQAAVQPPRAAVPVVRPAAPVAQPRPRSPGAQPVAAATPAAEPTPASAPAVDARPAPLPAAGEPDPVSPAPAGSPSGMGVAREEALAAYGHQLAELFGRVREYPRVAALRGWEGEVRLHLRIARKGQLLGVVLARSSGYEVLDRHAVAMIEDLPALPPLPGTLDASEIQIVVPISYRLGRTT